MGSYAQATFRNEYFKRNFQPPWFDKDSWLGFSVEPSFGYYYACEKYENSSPEKFEFRNGKKTRAS